MLSVAPEGGALDEARIAALQTVPVRGVDHVVAERFDVEVAGLVRRIRRPVPSPGVVRGSELILGNSRRLGDVSLRAVVLLAAVGLLVVDTVVNRAAVDDAVGGDGSTAVVEYVREGRVVDVDRAPVIADRKRLVAVVDPRPFGVRMLAVQLACPVDGQLPDIPDTLAFRAGHDALEVLAHDADLVQEVPEPCDFVAKIGREGSACSNAGMPQRTRFAHADEFIVITALIPDADVEDFHHLLSGRTREAACQTLIEAKVTLAKRWPEAIAVVGDRRLLAVLVTGVADAVPVVVLLAWVCDARTVVRVVWDVIAVCQCRHGPERQVDVGLNDREAGDENER